MKRELNTFGEKISEMPNESYLEISSSPFNQTDAFDSLENETIGSGNMWVKAIKYEKSSIYLHFDFEFALILDIFKFV